MGRLSTFAKNRILNLRFQKSYRIKQIAQTLLTEDNIKVSRKSISTFLKKYIETKSINDKPRSGRNKKLTPEEINLIGEVTRLNRDITAPKIKEYLNLNVSTYTILRASKLFEWNKLNPNSNEAKRQAALERQLNGEAAAAAAAATAAADANKSKSSSKNRKQQAAVLAAAAAAAINSNSVMNNTATIGNNGTMTTVKLEKRPTNKQTAKNKQISADDHYDPDAVMHLDLVPEAEIAFTKNISSSPMVFATKILYKIFKMDELIGHNVSGKTFNKFIKNKKALDEKRVNYIRYLVEKNFDASDREELWKSCRTAINKCIRNNEIKYAQAIGVPPNNLIIFQHKEELSGSEDMNDDSLIRISCPPTTTTTTSSSTTTATTNGATTLTLPLISEDDSTPTRSRGTTNTIVTLQPNMSIFQMSDEIVEPPSSSSSQQQPPHGLLLEDGATTLVTLAPSSQRVMTRSAAAAVAASTTASPQVQPTIIKLTDIDKDFDDDCKALLDLNNKSVKSDNESDEDMEESSGGEQLMTTNEDGSNTHHHVTLINSKLNHLVSSSELDEMRNQCCCSPMIFATKVLLRIFTKDELIGHNVSGKTYHKNLKNKQPLDEQRIEYIRSLVEAYFPQRKIDVVWKACRKAINRVIRNFEIKESKLNKSIDDDVDEIDFLIYSNSGTTKK